FFFSSSRRHTSSKRDWSSDVCSSDLRDFTAYRFSCVAIRGGAGQHRILCGNPAPVFALQPARYTLGEAGGAQDLGVAKRHDGRAFGVGGPTGFDGDIPKLGYGAIIGTSGQTILLLYGVSNAGNGYGQLTVKGGAGLLGGHQRIIPD